MSELRQKMDDLSGLMEEFGLEKAKLQGEDWAIEFAVNPPLAKGGQLVSSAADSVLERKVESKKSTSKVASAPTGIPINSPTTGIFYSSPNPSSPPFVKIGDTVEAGQVIGLIEAMKVFNEITSTLSGKVIRAVAQNGQLVQPGDPLLYIG